MPLSIRHYLDHMAVLTNQWTPNNYKSAKQRLYLKDIDCPELWQDKLKEHIPLNLFYMNECVGEVSGPAREFSRAGDLMSCLPIQMRAENMMCYIGHEGTYTPAHREMCASLGQNIMVEASGTVGEDGKPTRPGSSIWFMTESKDRNIVAEFWLSKLGHDIEVEKHFAQIEAWRQAPFKVYIVEQKVGDFILIPPLAPHQVWNRGTRTMKAAWNRTTVETLEMALAEALPRARMVCRDEQYKNKAIVLFALNRYSSILKNIEYQKSITRDDFLLAHPTTNSKVKQLQKDFKRLLRLYNEIMLSESFAAQHPEKKVEFSRFEGYITCSYCRCNIFNRFLTCKNCISQLDDGSEDTYDVCMECYAMGRSCACVSKLSWVEQFPWKDLLRKHETWRKQALRIDQAIPSKIKTPLALDEEQKKMDKKTLAEVCQEQLQVRPFQDPSKRQEQQENNRASEDEDPDGDNDSPRKRAKKRRSEKWLKENLPCHICCYRHPQWKMAVCECGAAFCYGSLWRGFDTMPQAIMEDPYWRCPKCREICNCTSCRKKPHNEPYQPKSTILGHDTRKFADPRSVETLVDFSSSNSHWVKKAGDNVDTTDSRRMQRKQQEAEFAKYQPQELDDEEEASERESNASFPIDPQIVGDAANGITSESWVADENQRVAQDALNAMGEKSQLELYTQEFINAAQLTGSLDGNVDENPGVIHNLLGSETVAKETGQRPGTKGKRDRRPLYKKKVEDEAASFANDANRRFYQSQAQKFMATAKKTGRLISARAAVTGESLIIKLRLSPANLARYGLAEQRSNGNSADHSNDLDEFTHVHVQSDLPKPAALSPKIPRKRHLSENEKDDTFGRTGERRNKRAVVQRPMAIDSQNDIDNSDDESPESDFEPDVRASAVPTGPKRRSLPAYLARRSPVRESDLPKELVSTPRERPTAKLSHRHSPSISTKRRPAPPATAAQSASTSSQASHPGPIHGQIDGAAGEADSNGSSSSGVEAEYREVANPEYMTPPAAASATSRHGTANSSSRLSTNELNRRAKLRALNGDISSSDESDDSLIARTPNGSRAKAGYSQPSIFEVATATRAPMAPAVVSSSASRPGQALRDPLAKRGRGRPPKRRGPGREHGHGHGQETSAPKPVQVQVPGPVRTQSIMAKKSRGGKLRIVSERTLQAAAQK